MSKSITQKQCKVDRCNGSGNLDSKSGKRYFPKGYCHKHYQRLKRYGSLDFVHQVRDGRTKDGLYKRWKDIKHRCYCKNNTYYSRYGGRGITLSDEFKDYRVFKEYLMSLDNAMFEGYSIDRIDNDGDYTRGNLRWATQSQQACNRSSNNDVVGVSLNKRDNVWRARLKSNSIEHGKSFKSKTLAIEHRKKLEEMYL
jgi:hypothetical protein